MEESRKSVSGPRQYTLDELSQMRSDIYELNSTWFLTSPQNVEDIAICGVPQKESEIERILQTCVMAGIDPVDLKERAVRLREHKLDAFERHKKHLESIRNQTSTLPRDKQVWYDPSAWTGRR